MWRCVGNVCARTQQRTLRVAELGHVEQEATFREASKHRGAATHTGKTARQQIAHTATNTAAVAWGRCQDRQRGIRTLTASTSRWTGSHLDTPPTALTHHYWCTYEDIWMLKQNVWCTVRLGMRLLNVWILIKLCIDFVWSASIQLSIYLERGRKSLLDISNT